MTSTKSEDLPVSASPVPIRHHLDRRADKIAEDAEGLSDDDLLTTPQVAQWLCISTQWLEIGRHKGYGPSFVRMTPKRVRYRRADVRAWLASRTHASTREYAE